MTQSSGGKKQVVGDTTDRGLRKFSPARLGYSEVTIVNSRCNGDIMTAIYGNTGPGVRFRFPAGHLVRPGGASIRSRRQRYGKLGREITHRYVI